MRMRNDLILVFGLSVSLAGIATATEAVQPPAAVPPAQQTPAPVHAPAATGVVAPAVSAPAAAVAPAAAATPVAPAAPAATVAAAEEDPMVCKKITETGTLGRRKKLCMTASQWEEHRKAARGVMRGIDSAAGAQNSGVPGGG